MQYALFYAEGPDALPYVPADDNVGEWVDEIEARGVSEYGERLRPEHDATTVRVRNGEVLVVDGPFTEAKEIIGGYWIWQVSSMEEAVEWAKQCPTDRSGAYGALEIRPYAEDEDFGEELTPELREREARLAEELRARRGEG